MLWWTYCFRVQELILDSNQIELISDRAFAGLTHLKRLCLSHNRLTSLSPGVLGGVPAINYLDLRSNHLETLTLDSIKPIMTNLYNDTSYFHIEGKCFSLFPYHLYMRTITLYLMIYNYELVFTNAYLYINTLWIINHAQMQQSP